MCKKKEGERERKRERQRGTEKEKDRERENRDTCIEEGDMKTYCTYLKHWGQNSSGSLRRDYMHVAIDVQMFLILLNLYILLSVFIVLASYLVQPYFKLKEKEKAGENAHITLRIRVCFYIRI